MTTAWGPRPETSPGREPEFLPVLDIPPPGRQRRWTVLLRWLLLVPQFVVGIVLLICSFFVTIVGWFAALFLGRLPEGIYRFLGSVLVYTTRIEASAVLLVDRYPPFAFEAPDHPVQIELRPTPLNRLAVLFRLILMIPAVIISNLLQTGWMAVCWIFWIITLVLGRLPGPLYTATATVTRYTMRTSAYVHMLTPAYPKRLFGDEPVPGGEVRSGTRPLVLDTPATFLVVLFLVLGIAADAVNSTTRYDDGDDDRGAHTYGSHGVPWEPQESSGSVGAR
jgi:hypothetical protein